MGQEEEKKGHRKGRGEARKEQVREGHKIRGFILFNIWVISTESQGTRLPLTREKAGRKGDTRQKYNEPASITMKSPKKKGRRGKV